MEREPIIIRDMRVGMWCWKRPQYLRRTLKSWAAVDGVHELRSITIALEPSERKDEMLEIVEHAQKTYGLDNIEVIHNETQLGVLVNPVVSGSAILQNDPDTEFLICMDEDMLLSDDVLRYFEWAANKFEDDKTIFGVCAHTAENGTEDADQSAVQLLPRFRTWVWGTWPDRWFNVAVPTWDKDYSSGEPSGYDWNLDLRVVPELGLKCVFPVASRSQNTGQYGGVHASPAEFWSTLDPSFRYERGKVEYRLVDE